MNKDVVKEGLESRWGRAQEGLWLSQVCGSQGRGRQQGEQAPRRRVKPSRHRPAAMQTLRASLTVQKGLGQGCGAGVELTNPLTEELENPAENIPKPQEVRHRAQDQVGRCWHLQFSKKQPFVKKKNNGNWIAKAYSTARHLSTSQR